MQKPGPTARLWGQQHGLAAAGVVSDLLQAPRGSCSPAGQGADLADSLLLPFVACVVPGSFASSVQFCSLPPIPLLSSRLMY